MTAEEERKILHGDPTVPHPTGLFRVGSLITSFPAATAAFLRGMRAAAQLRSFWSDGPRNGAHLGMPYVKSKALARIAARNLARRRRRAEKRSFALMGGHP